MSRMILIVETADATTEELRSTLRKEIAEALVDFEGNIVVLPPGSHAQAHLLIG